MVQRKSVEDAWARVALNTAFFGRRACLLVCYYPLAASAAKNCPHAAIDGEGPLKLLL